MMVKRFHCRAEEPTNAELWAMFDELPKSIRDIINAVGLPTHAIYLVYEECGEIATLRALQKNKKVQEIMGTTSSVEGTSIHKV